MKDRKLLIKHFFFDMKFKSNRIKIVNFSNLTTDLCKKYKSKIILRGLRAVSDFDYEFQMVGMNARLNPNIETVFLMASENQQFISSRFVKEIASLGGDVSSFVSLNVLNCINQNIKK